MSSVRGMKNERTFKVELSLLYQQKTAQLLHYVKHYKNAVKIALMLQFHLSNSEIKAIQNYHCTGFNGSGSGLYTRPYFHLPLISSSAADIWVPAYIYRRIFLGPSLSFFKACTHLRSLPHGHNHTWSRDRMRSD